MGTYCLGQDLPLTTHIQLADSSSPSSSSSSSSSQSSSQSSSSTTSNTKKIRGEVLFPHFHQSEGKEDVVLVFAKGKQAEEARRLGARIVGGEELIQE
ncbi:hypothetical protein HK102_007784, partial [Quaeritorhiza haematococci]